MIDKEGYRPNVGIVLANDRGQVLWARRVGGRDAWQFPQGGINRGESPEQALYRELEEEIGLAPRRYRITPEANQRKEASPAPEAKTESTEEKK